MGKSDAKPAPERDTGAGSSDTDKTSSTTDPLDEETKQHAHEALEGLGEEVGVTVSKSLPK